MQKIKLFSILVLVMIFIEVTACNNSGGGGSGGGGTELESGFFTTIAVSCNLSLRIVRVEQLKAIQYF
ncbi:MAG: hypothetical protein FWE72_03505 [Spirochaetaceae bacterium]|nr:hypothetical protein [Spirochaetaceae bacterium]